MDMAHQDDHHICDTGLVLGLGYGRRSTTSYITTTTAATTTNTTTTTTTRSSSHRMSPAPATGLTLSLSDDALGLKMDANNDGKTTRISSPHSTLSSFSTAYPPSVKKEKDMVSEEAEVERVLSSRASTDDEDGSGARKKLRLTKDQSALLEERFKEHSTLNPKQKQALAKQLNLRPRQVEVWFQNRRARTKLKQTEVDFELLKRCCETLTEENRRLQKELQELKALKFATPLYMQLPAATLTMCPSCERIAGASEATKGLAGAATGAGVGSSPFVIAPKPHFFNPFSTHPAAC